MSNLLYYFACNIYATFPTSLKVGGLRAFNLTYRIYRATLYLQTEI